MGRLGGGMKKNLTKIARELRRGATESEKMLWWRLNRRQIEGIKFRRQQPIGRYIVDFVNFEQKLIIELDGGQHRKQKEEDEKRDKWFEQQGFRVLRFWSHEIFENLDGILEVIRKAVLSPSPSPSHQGRGGLRKD
jgi:very-short-patch-repair endonuclease